MSNIDITNLLMQAEATLIDQGIYLDPDLAPTIAEFTLKNGLAGTGSDQHVTIQRFTPGSIVIMVNGLDMLMLTLSSDGRALMSAVDSVNNEASDIFVPYRMAD